VRQEKFCLNDLSAKVWQKFDVPERRGSFALTPARCLHTGASASRPVRALWQQRLRDQSRKKPGSAVFPWSSSGVAIERI
jgi:hypothetical protein